MNKRTIIGAAVLLLLLWLCAGAAADEGILPESLTLDRQEVTLNIGRTDVPHWQLLPRQAKDRRVVWSSSDEGVARVSADGRVTAVGAGTCEITCASAAAPDVLATYTVHVQKPLTRIVFDQIPEIWVGETPQLTWKTEPADATNPAVTLKSGNTRILTLADDGTATPVKAGWTWIFADAADGSGRHASAKVRVLQHVEGVHMYRHTAYIELGYSSSTGAVLEPADASNRNMTWESADPGIAGASGKSNRVKITGRAIGDTVVTGTTEDGGYQASINVKVGHWDRSLKLRSFRWNKDGRISLQVKNAGDLNITQITAEVYFYDAAGNELPVSKKDGSNMVRAVWSGYLAPGETTGSGSWRLLDYDPPASLSGTSGVVQLYSFQIDEDWVVTIRKAYRPTMEW